MTLPILFQFLLSFLIVSFVQANEEISMHEYLSSAGSIHIEGENALIRSGKNTPYLRNGKFKYTHTDVEKENNKYELQLFPTGWGETSAADNIQKSMLKKMSADNNKILSEEIASRYKDIIRLISLKEIYENYIFQETIMKGLTNVAETNITKVFNEKSKLHNPNIESLFKGALEQEIWKTVIVDTKLEIRTLEDKISQKVNGAKLKNNIYLPAVQSLISKLNEKNTVNLIDSESPSIISKTENTNYFLAEYKYEEAVAKRYIDSIAIELNQRKDENRYSFNITLNLPLFSSNKVGINKSILRYSEINYELEQLKITSRVQLQHLADDVIQSLERVRDLENSAISTQLKKYIDTYSQLKGADPELVLKLKMMKSRSEVELIKIKQKALEKYIDYLNATGVLIGKREINFLSEKWEKF